jgi:DNA-directed RNA polymerase subunit M/transcription elongation factor TFIIS
MKKIFLFLLTILISISISVSFALPPGNSNGAADFILDGGNKGDVFFPHRKHQNTVFECSKCHNLFPKQRGEIVKMKKSNKLEKKQVMNHCRDCHKEMKRKGQRSGPTGCMKCHNKQ